MARRRSGAGGRGGHLVTGADHGVHDPPAHLQAWFAQARPGRPALRTVREWLATYPALVSEPLGGDWRDPSEWQHCMGSDAIPFWEVLDLPAELRNPVPGETDTAVCMDTTTRLVEAGWFAAHGLDEQVDRAALSFHGYRTLAAWQDSDFAPLLRPRSSDRASPPPG